MTMYSLCQRCFGDRERYWNVHQAEFHVGQMTHWKVQLCAECTTAVEQAVLAALQTPERPSATRTQPEKGVGDSNA